MVGGTTLNARLIPSEMAATSLDFREGTVRREVVSIKSCFIALLSAIVVIASIPTEALP